MPAPAVEQEPLLLQRTSPQLVGELKRYLERHNVEIGACVARAGPDSGVKAGERLAKIYDGLLMSLFNAVRAAMSREGQWQPAEVAAVGTWGRGAVALHSDLDVRLLCGAESHACSAAMEALLYPLWDAGLTIGHQVLTVDELIELSHKDLPTATSVLDWRTIATDPGFEVDVLDRVFDGLFGPGVIGEFIERLARRAEERNEKYGGSVYLLEPDVKYAAGGLRDLDVARWAARARWKVRSLRGLVRIGVLVPREYRQIHQASEFLWRVRNLLHQAAGRRSDRLSFERQEKLAEMLGYGQGGRAVERFMSEYYREARAVTRARDMLLSRAMPPPRRAPRTVNLGGGLRITQNAMSLEVSALDADPALALRLFDEAVCRDLPVYPFARDAVVRAVGSDWFCEQLRSSEEAARLFTRLVTVTQRTQLKHGSVVRELHEVGLLAAMIPEFTPVVGRVHHDIYHVYTVDAHSVAAVERLAKLCRGELAGEFRLASRLAAEIARPTVLFFATLLHDIGKDIGGRSHSQRGAQLAAKILDRLCVPEEDAEQIRHLILKHLTMYHVATRRDVDDPQTIKGFLREPRGREGLRELYLLTVCDLSTTSPTAMTSWKARMLDELYVLADRVLSEGAEDLDREGTEGVRQQVRELWGGESVEFLEHFLAAMPERYLFANAPDAIVEHVRLAFEARERAGAVRLLAQDERYVEFAFVADDRPGLLALITATLAAAHLQVVGAQIFSWSCSGGQGRALDLFWVKTGSHTDLDALGHRLERDLLRLVRGELEPEQLGGGLRPRPAFAVRPAPRVRTEINIDNRAATSCSVLEIATRDRMGLLFRLARTLQQEGLTISLAKINTEGDRVADVFYVMDANGAKLTDPHRVGHLKNAILATIAELENRNRRNG